jgi:hypothetical protein
VSCMTVKYTVTIDCADPEALVRFWAHALGYVPKPPPDGFETWRAWYLGVGVPAEELGEGDCLDRLIDPEGNGPDIWFQPVPEGKVVKNRIHFDLAVGGGRAVPLDVRRQRTDAKVAELLAAGASTVRVNDGPGYDDHYGVVLRDPEGNEFCVS